MKVKKETQ